MTKTAEPQVPLTSRLDGMLRTLKLTSTNTNGGGHNKKAKLHWAVIAGNSKEVEALLSSTFLPKRRTSILKIVKGYITQDFNAQDEFGRSALHWAAARGHVECAKLLVNHPTTKIVQDGDGKTPLHEAVINGNRSIV
jgi:ankyrin repeat protein